MDNLRLQQDVLKLRARLSWVIAILRLFVVVLKTSDVSLSNIRFPEGTAKRMLLRTIERSSCVLPVGSKNSTEPVFPLFFTEARWPQLTGSCD
jgi:hypothetical protein